MRADLLSPAHIDVPDPVPLRVVADHIAIIEIAPGAGRRRLDSVQFLQRQRQRLFTQNRLASLEGTDRHRHVKMVWQRVVDGIDIRACQ